jgi:hypothetical protein
MDGIHLQNSVLKKEMGSLHIFYFRCELIGGFHYLLIDGLHMLLDVGLVVLGIGVIHTYLAVNNTKWACMSLMMTKLGLWEEVLALTAIHQVVCV